MNYVVVYWSRYGTNERLMDALAEKLRESGGEIQTFKTDELDPAAMPAADIYIFSAPTEAFRIQKNMRRFIKSLSGMAGKKCAVVNTHSMKRNWLRCMQRMLSKKKMVTVTAADFRVGEVADEQLGLLGDWEARLDAFAGRLSDPSSGVIAGDHM